MRKMAGVPSWHSANTIFVNNQVRSFFENVRATSLSLMNRVLKSENTIVKCLVSSNSYAFSAQREMWLNNIFTSSSFPGV